MAVRIKDKKKIALVLSGGGVKAAAFHMGVCMALQEKGFRFVGGTKEEVQRNFSDQDPMTIRMYVGSSAGAFLSAILSHGYDLNALINAFLAGSGSHRREDSLSHLKPLTYRHIFSVNGRHLLHSLPRILFNRSIFKGGLEALVKEKFKVNGFFSTKGLEKYLKDYALTHNEFHQLGAELYIIGTQLNDTKKAIFGHFPEPKEAKGHVYVDYASISQAVAASVSLPPIFCPVAIPDRKGVDQYFFDGEIRDALSTHVAADLGADFVIASYSYQPYHYNPELGSLHNYGIPMIVNQALYQTLQQKIERHIRYTQDMKAIYQAVDGYFRSCGLPDEHRQRVLEIIRERVQFKPNTDYLYISPRAQNYEMFFADHFSLNPQVLERILKIGFRSALSQLRTLDL